MKWEEETSHTVNSVTVMSGTAENYADLRHQNVIKIVILE